jgi:hypothetical protein
VLAVSKRVIGLLISISMGLIMLLGDVYYGWLTLIFSIFLGLFSFGLMISSIFLGKKALYWGLIGILPLIIFFGVSAIKKF